MKFEHTGPCYLYESLVCLEPKSASAISTLFEMSILNEEQQEIPPVVLLDPVVEDIKGI